MAADSLGGVADPVAARRPAHRAGPSHGRGGLVDVLRRTLGDPSLSVDVFPTQRGPRRGVAVLTLLRT